MRSKARPKVFGALHDCARLVLYAFIAARPATRCHNDNDKTARGHQRISPEEFMTQTVSTNGAPERYKLVLLCILAVFVCYIDRVNISVAVIAMQEHYGWSERVHAAERVARQSLGR
jgi:hypothetical protein